jgi:hypothetical protein
MMAKILKTAPELERYIMLELRNCAACNSIAAVTVAETGQAESNWEVAHVNALGGVVPTVCREICNTAAARLRERYDLVTEIEPEDM